MKHSIAAVLILTSSLWVGAQASASTSLIWADSVHSAALVAESARVEIGMIEDCKGLEDVLILGANGSGIILPGRLGELRNRLMELDLLAATVQFTAEQARDAAAQEALTQMRSLKSSVMTALNSRLSFCGNGVEK